MVDKISIEKKMLFAPGPVLTSERVKKAALQPDICHRSPMFEQIYSGLKSRILKLFNADSNTHHSIVVSGSGTAANETVISSVFNDEEEILIISNGEFGNRLIEIADAYKVGSRVVEFDWGEYPDINKVEDFLKRYSRIKLVSMVYHETSTGMINPVEEVGRLAKKYGKLYHVDAISAVGGENVDVTGQQIDFCTGVPNKSVAGHPGASFVCVNLEAYKQVKNIRGRNVYLNLQKHVEISMNKNQTPNTPAVVMFLTLYEALDELFEEGLNNRIERYKRDADIIRDAVKKRSLKLLIDNDEWMSTTVTSVFLPENIDVYSFVNEMYRRGYVIYLGKGPLLKKNMFQIANMGNIHPEDCYRFVEVFNDVLDSYR